MQSTSVASSPHCYYIHHHHHPKGKPFSLPLTSNQSFCSLTLTQSNHICSSKESEKKKKKGKFEQFYCFIDTNPTTYQNPETLNQHQRRQDQERGSNMAKSDRGLSTNMLWTDMKAALGQRINLEGIISSVAVIGKDRQLALPHVAVADIRYIDWVELHRRGFKGVVFDKDNTITAPYSLALWDPIRSSIEQCKSVFGADVAVFSNSAGLKEYDYDYSKARVLERSIGIKVIRHRVKKPAGTAEEIEKHFGCKSSQLIMVGDRPFTDVVYGNRNGFLTIWTEPLSLAEEPLIVRQVRKLETAFVHFWQSRGLKPSSHNLLLDTTQCVKDPSPL